ATKVALEPGLTYLEQRSISKPVLADYRRRAQAFVTCASESHLDWRGSAELDSVLVGYFNLLYFQGYSGDDASKLLAAVKFFVANLSRWGTESLPRCSRALAGWGKCVPRRSRQPLPWLVVAALAGVLLRWQLVEHVVAMILSFSTYMRPGEVDSLVGLQVVEGVAEGSGNGGVVALVLFPEEMGVPSKTGMWDMTVPLDTFRFLGPSLLALKRRCRTLKDRLWSCPPGDLGQKMRAAAEELGRALASPYQLRHGGASDDLVARRRTALEIQARGGWASPQSFLRYAKPGRILAEMAKLPAGVLDFGRAVDVALAEIFLRG
ncbi:unnamed protein product, partial [Prorocentrum cordatum]